MSRKRKSRDEDDLRYQRVGHIPQGRLCDMLARACTILQKGSLMPPRWKMLPPEEFVQVYGLGPKWSRTQSYHLFLYDGVPLYRVWTNTSADFVWVDLDSTLAASLASYFTIEPIPAGNLKKCKPFTRRIKATSADASIFLVTLAKAQYEN